MSAPRLADVVKGVSEVFKVLTGPFNEDEVDVDDEDAS